MNWILPLLSALPGLWLAVVSLANALQTSTAFSKPRSVNREVWFSVFISLLLLPVSLLCFLPLWHRVFG